MGLDFTIYLRYVRYCAIFFLFVAIITCAVLLPEYCADSDDLKSCTLVNSIDNATSMFLCFFVTFLVTIAGHVFVYLFETSINADYTFHTKRQDISQHTIVKHSIFVRNLKVDQLKHDGDESLKKLKRFMNIILHDKVRLAWDSNFNPPKNVTNIDRLETQQDDATTNN